MEIISRKPPLFFVWKAIALYQSPLVFPNKKQRQSPTMRKAQKLKPPDATKGKKQCPYWRNKYLQER